MGSKMWDFLPMERDEYVSAEDDAVMLEHEREKQHAQNLIDECPECKRYLDECICQHQPLEEPKTDDYISAEGPEFSQEYESPEDVYAESDNYDD